MEKIQPGMYVELVYDLYEIAPDGNDKLVHQTVADDPEKIVYGVTPGMIRPLEAAIEGLEAGKEFDVKVSANEAFGPYDKEQIANLPRDIFEIDGKFDDKVIKAGAILPMMTADGYRINGVVKEVTPDTVVMDFNHPLAGKDVRFKGSVLTVREATQEELHPQCGGGCCGSCGDECGDGCGDGKCGCGDSCSCDNE